MLLEIRGDLYASVCALGLTMVVLVVVEIWGEVSPFWEILGTQFLHLEMSQQGAETQVLGKYCRSVS